MPSLSDPLSAPSGGKNAAALAAVTAGNVIWGFTFLFTRVAERSVDPAVLLSWRFTLAFLLMNLLVLTGRGTVRLRGKRLLPLILLMGLEIVYFYFESYSILYTNTTFSGVVLSVAPIVSILLAIVFLKEYPTRRQAVFCLLPVSGVILMAMAGKSLGVLTPLGAVLLAGSCFCSGAYKTANRKAAEEFTSFERTYAMIGSGCIVFTLSALFTTRADPQLWLAPIREPKALACIAALSVLGSITANTLVNYAAGILPVVKVSTFGALSTLITTLAGVLLLHEPMSLMGAVGAALIIVGIWQVTTSGAKTKS